MIKKKAIRLIVENSTRNTPGYDIDWSKVSYFEIKEDGTIVGMGDNGETDIKFTIVATRIK